MQAKKVGAPARHDKVKVAIRVRPFLPRERSAGDRCVLRLEGRTITIRQPDWEPSCGPAEMFEHSVRADYAFADAPVGADGGAGLNGGAGGSGASSTGEETSPAAAAGAMQARVFEQLGADVVDSALRGYNCSVFAYGQTGSGKTHTIVGTRTDPGVMFLAVVGGCTS